MNQIESMIVTMAIGFSVVLFFRFIPIKLSPFTSRRANSLLGQAFGLILLNLWPALSEVALVNGEGEPLYPLLGYFTILGFVFYFSIAVRAEKRSSKL